MWKKPGPQPSLRAEPEKVVRTPLPPSKPTVPARIGPSVVVKGEVYGEEDLVIEGKVDGKITVKTGSVTVGEKGTIDADIQAVSIQVAGNVKGNLAGAEKVVLLESGRVEGNITAKSVTLENGCRFKGSIDMESSRSVSTALKPIVSDPVTRAQA